MRGWWFCAVLFLLIPFSVTDVASIASEKSVRQSAPRAVVRGLVRDTSRGTIAGAQVTVTPNGPGVPTSAVTDAEGGFEIAVVPGGYTVRVSANGFVDANRRVTISQGTAIAVDFILEVAGFQESVSVDAAIGYSVPAVSSATKTATPLRDIPQAISVVSRALIADLRMSSMADITRYMPGVSTAQGEGNRDTPIMRGNSSTSDFFVDGVRDDVQYFRDVL